MTRYEWFELAAWAVLWFAGAAYLGSTAADTAADLVPPDPIPAVAWVLVVWLPLWTAPMLVVYVAAIRPIMLAAAETRASRASGGHLPHSHT